jgi:hypothetical protein
LARPILAFIFHLSLDSKQSARKQSTFYGDEIQGNDEYNVNSGDTISSDLIAAQMGRAIARWEEAYAKKYFDKNIYNCVLEKLQIGEVPPIYHPFCRDPMKRLFLPYSVVSNGKEHSGNIEISATEVKAGISRPCEESTDLQIWKKYDFSYLEAFFTNDGHYRTNVWDNVLKENWEFDQNITNIVTDLVNSSSKMVGHDLEVTKLPCEFPLDLFNGKNLITRSLSRGVVADCFEHSKPGSVHAIVGSPGIGKSWSLIYALQQALLFENACVMFCFQNKKRAWVCIRMNNQIYAWSMISESLKTDSDSGLFQNGNVLALLDPKEAPAGGASYTRLRQRLIFSASNNAAHFKNTYKETFDYERILNPYSTLELEIALKFMSSSDDMYLDVEVRPMLLLAGRIGNLPRYIMSDKSAEPVTTKVKEHIQEIGKMDSAKLLDFLGFKGITGVEESKTIKGAIFSLFAGGSIHKDFTLTDVGYDGDAVVDGEAAVDYHRRLVQFVSMNVAAQVAHAHRGTLLSYDGKSMNGLGSHFGHIVEDLFWMDMEKNIIMQVYDLKTKAEPGNINFYFKNAFEHGKQTRLKDLGRILMAPDGGKSKCRIIVNGALIDFAMGREVFQVTVQTTHSVNRQGVKDLFIAGGILEDKNNVLSYSKEVQPMIFDNNPNLLEKWKIKFYWVVPNGVSDTWKKKMPLNVDADKKVAKNNKGDEKEVGNNKSQGKRQRVTDLVDEAWERFVDQYVAVMSSNLAEAEEERN